MQRNRGVAAILDDDVVFRRPQPAGLRWIIQRLAHQQTMHLEDPVDAQGAVLQMPQGLHHRVVVEDHLLASITRLAPRAEHFLRDLARGGCALQLRGGHGLLRSEEHTSELQSLMRISYAVFCLQKKKTMSKLNTTYSEQISN